MWHIKHLSFEIQDVAIKLQDLAYVDQTTLERQANTTTNRFWKLC